MSRIPLSRRRFIQTAAGIAAAAHLPHWFGEQARAGESKNDRPILGLIGAGGQGTSIARRASETGADIAAIADVDRTHAERAKGYFEKADLYEDYRRLLERKDIEAVLIATPDHWHTAVALAALDAGKHVYCEKPMTLTIDEGKQLVAAVRRTGKTFQVGTQQRGDQYTLFGRAVATVRSGRLGKISNVKVCLPLSRGNAGPYATAPVPSELNWDAWQGQAPAVEYVPQRCHSSFRWWYEYSGGILTDWGAHHLDITQWALGMDNSGPLSIDGTRTVLLNIPGGYNTPRNPLIEYQYPGDVTVQVTAASEGVGVTFEGDKGRIYVDRGRITGAPIEEQDADPAAKEKIMNDVKALFKGNLAKLGNHVGNFFEGFKHNLPVISDVGSQHRSASVCHLGNISIRLGRKIQWDADRQEIVGDSEANAMLRRAQRAPYQTEA